MGGVALPLRVVHTLSGHRWMDRLVRSRMWIAIIAVALMGIVATQVTLLQMNTGVGRAVESAATLERQNADVRLELSHLTETGRIERFAQTLGMVRPGPDDLTYRRVTSRSTDARRAVQTMRAPAPPGALLAAAQAAAPPVTAPAAPAGATQTTVVPVPAGTVVTPVQTPPPAATAPAITPPPAPATQVVVSSAGGATPTATGAP